MPSNSIGHIIKNYKAFVLDSFGVLRNSSRYYKEAGKTVEKMRSIGEVFVLSNTANLLPEKMHYEFKKNGIDIEIENIITSGMVLKQTIKEFGLKGKQVLNIGNEATGKYILDAEAGITENIDEAEAAVIGYFITDENYKIFQMAIKLARYKVFPCILANTDLLMPSFGDKLIEAPGITGKIYENLTGLKTIKIGKPYAPIYDIVNEILKKKGIDKNEVLAVGDTHETDIMGGSRRGYETLLVLSGVTGIQYKNKLNELEKLKPQPTYILPNIFWNE